MSHAAASHRRSRLVSDAPRQTPSDAHSHLSGAAPDHSLARALTTTSPRAAPTEFLGWNARLIKRHGVCVSPFQSSRLAEPAWASVPCRRTFDRGWDGASSLVSPSASRVRLGRNKPGRCSILRWSACLESFRNQRCPNGLASRIGTQRQAETPLQLLYAPFVKTIAFRALTGLRSAARQWWLEDPKRRTR
jgi:hypothetical protein